MPAQPPASARATNTNLSRRRFLGLGSLFALGAVAPAVVNASPQRALSQQSTALKPGALAVEPRRLAFHNLHTEERLETIFWANGRLVPQALAEINHLLRDHRTNDVRAIDPQLLALLHALKHKVGTRQPFQIISGYRSPRTNAALRAHSSGVASRSLHMQGRAVDIALPGCGLERLRQAALSLRGGGVGYYPRPGFIHVDTGPVRHWA